MATSANVRLATTGDVDGMAECLAWAFEDHPIKPWLFGDEPPRPTRWPMWREPQPNGSR